MESRPAASEAGKAKVPEEWRKNLPPDALAYISALERRTAETGPLAGGPEEAPVPAAESPEHAAAAGAAERSEVLQRLNRHAEAAQAAPEHGAADAAEADPNVARLDAQIAGLREAWEQGKAADRRREELDEAFSKAVLPASVASGVGIGLVGGIGAGFVTGPAVAGGTLLGWSAATAATTIGITGGFVGLALPVAAYGAWKFYKWRKWRANEGRFDKLHALETRRERLAGKGRR